MQISSNIPAQSSPRHVFVVSMRSDLPSLTPRFSEVPVRLKAANRFSDFSGAGKKPLKRLSTLALAFPIPLKRDVNDIHSSGR
jgi:hypothetical protein